MNKKICIPFTHWSNDDPSISITLHFLMREIMVCTNNSGMDWGLMDGVRRGSKTSVDWENRASVDWGSMTRVNWGSMSRVDWRIGLY